jgi:hypothetical protein
MNFTNYKLIKMNPNSIIFKTLIIGFKFILFYFIKCDIEVEKLFYGCERVQKLVLLMVILYHNYFDINLKAINFSS